jgi:hypothetical protein
MDPNAPDTLMQVIGVGAVILPMAVLCAGLAIASHRRRAAELAESAEPASEP